MEDSVPSAITEFDSEFDPWTLGVFRLEMRVARFIALEALDAPVSIALRELELIHEAEKELRRRLKRAIRDVREECERQP